MSIEPITKSLSRHERVLATGVPWPPSAHVDKVTYTHTQRYMSYKTLVLGQDMLMYFFLFWKKGGKKIVMEPNRENRVGTEEYRNSCRPLLATQPFLVRERVALKLLEILVTNYLSFLATSFS